MKLFKQQDFGCQHTFKERIKAKKKGVEYKGDRACQGCLLHDWWYGYRSHYIGQYLELPLILLYRPFWWLKYGRKMDAKGYMPHEKNYKGKYKK